MTVAEFTLCNIDGRLGDLEMRDKRLRALTLGAMLLAFGVAVAIALAPATAQHAALTPVLISQPGSPLAILSMKQVPITIPPNVPPQVAARMAKYELVMQNKTNLPIVAYTIGHKHGAEERYGTCQSSYGFTGPMVEPAETKTIDMMYISMRPRLHL
jgi:hypothetical protein